jgi:hypothetical protein
VNQLENFKYSSISNQDECTSSIDVPPQLKFEVCRNQ